MDDHLAQADIQLRQLRAANYAIEQDLAAKAHALEVDYVSKGCNVAKAASNNLSFLQASRDLDQTSSALGNHDLATLRLGDEDPATWAAHTHSHIAKAEHERLAGAAVREAIDKLIKAHSDSLNRMATKVHAGSAVNCLL